MGLFQADQPPRCECGSTQCVRVNRAFGRDGARFGSPCPSSRGTFRVPGGGSRLPSILPYPRTPASDLSSWAARNISLLFHYTSPETWETLKPGPPAEAEDLKVGHVQRSGSLKRRASGRSPRDTLLRQPSRVPALMGSWQGPDVKRRIPNSVVLDSRPCPFGAGGERGTNEHRFSRSTDERGGPVHSRLSSRACWFPGSVIKSGSRAAPRVPCWF